MVSNLQKTSRNGRAWPCIATLLGIIYILCCSAASCQAQKLPARDFTINTAHGDKVQLNAEIARTEKERETGLMYRKQLDEGKGMLFVFSVDQYLSFWMKNTFIPLSVAYISSDGVIREIHNMQPRDLTPILGKSPCRYALEVPLGWFEKVGVSTGDRLALPPEL